MRCPGQDTRFWKPGDIFETQCPKCGRKIEFFKDEVRRTCRCGHEVVNPKMDLGCAAWCQYAEQCIGVLPEEMKVRQRAEEKDLLKERISLEMKKFWGTHYTPVRHALKVARYAEKILRMEGGNPLVVMGAAYLHGLGKPGTETEGRNSFEKGKKEGLGIVKEILGRLAVEEEAKSEIVDIIKRLHRPRDEESLNFQILYEADWLATMEEGENTDSQIELGERIQKNFKTVTGRELLREFFLRS